MNWRNLLTGLAVAAAPVLGSAASLAATVSPPAPPVSIVSGVTRVPPLVGTTIIVGPCDLIAAGGQVCSAAHSMTRRLFGNYTGPLFQLYRGSDTTTLDIGTTSTGLYNKAAVDAFCHGTDCQVTILYDQSGNANHLWSGSNEPTPTPAQASPWTIHWQKNLPVLQTGWLADKTTGNIYRNRAHTTNLPTGATPSTTYYARPTDIWGEWGDYGRGENPYATLCGGINPPTCPAGASFAMGFGIGAGTGAGGAPPYNSVNTPYLGVDQEYYMPAYTMSPIPLQMVAFAKEDGSNIRISFGDATVGALSTLVNAASAYAPMRVQNGLQFSEGGDATPSGLQFFEGAITTGMTSDVTDKAVAANVAAFYSSAAATPPAPGDDLYSTGGANLLGTIQSTKAFGGMWGLRRMRNSYTGYAALVTRESDSTSLNVGFDAAGSFDDIAAQTFCAGTVCHAQLMNQVPIFAGPTTSHATRDMVNVTLSIQPTLVFNGLNGRTVLAFNGSQYLCTFGISGMGSKSWFLGAVAKRTGLFTTAQAIAGENSSTVLGFAALASTTNFTTQTATVMNGATLTDNSWGLILGLADVVAGTGSVIVNNGAPVAATQAVVSNPNGTLCIGRASGSASATFVGQLSEAFLGGARDSPAPTAAQLTTLYNDAHAYYGGAF